MSGAICKLCKKDMLKVSGCICDTVEINGKKYKRVPVGNYGETMGAGEKCHDCGAHFDKYHHEGCDIDKCPVCRGQAGMGCDCEEFSYIVIRKVTEPTVQPKAANIKAINEALSVMSARTLIMKLISKKGMDMQRAVDLLKDYKPYLNTSSKQKLLILNKYMPGKGFVE